MTHNTELTNKNMYTTINENQSLRTNNINTRLTIKKNNCN